jgi:hypothetical protein
MPGTHEKQNEAFRVFIHSVAAEAGKRTFSKSMNPKEAIGSGCKLGYSDPSDYVDWWIIARWKT